MLSSRIFSQTSRPAARWLSQTTGRRMASSMPQTEQVAHTVTGRVKRWAVTLPVEIYPLFAVMGFSLSMGIYSMIRRVRADPTLRLHRSSNAKKNHNSPMSWQDQIGSA